MEESTIDASSEVRTIAQTVVSTTIVLTSTPVGDHLITSSLENEEGLASGGAVRQLPINLLRHALCTA